MARQQVDSDGVSSQRQQMAMESSHGDTTSVQQIVRESSHRDSRWRYERSADSEGVFSWRDSERIGRDSCTYKPQSVWWSGEAAVSVQ